jgi:hypothetical protein
MWQMFSLILPHGQCRIVPSFGQALSFLSGPSESWLEIAILREGLPKAISGAAQQEMDRIGAILKMFSHSLAAVFLTLAGNKCRRRLTPKKRET